MDKALAELLDTRVAERFGKPDLGWDTFDAPDYIFSAAWESHLLDQCWKREWNAHVYWTGSVTISVHAGDFVDQDKYTEAATTRLEALARAMLAVPEDKT